jgi:hypothetical protein
VNENRTLAFLITRQIRGAQSPEQHRAIVGPMNQRGESSSFKRTCIKLKCRGGGQCLLPVSSRLDGQQPTSTSLRSSKIRRCGMERPHQSSGPEVDERLKVHMGISSGKSALSMTIDSKASGSGDCCMDCGGMRVAAK